ncbi:MAG: hypothetical protein CMJ18_26280 [Phycisphaeraceae bacterium]|nr:hypothetical protein [Phycisphaeraceae bacterium]
MQAQQVLARSLLALSACGCSAAGQAEAPPKPDRITRFSVSYTEHSFRVIVRSVDDDPEIGGCRIRVTCATRAAPPGFSMKPGGLYAYLGRTDRPAGDVDNGTYDDDPQAGVYARTISTRRWPPGVYRVSAGPTNDPPSKWNVNDDRKFRFEVDDQGRVIGKRGLETENARGTHVVIYRKKDVYACFPSLLKLEGEDSLFTDFATRSYRSHTDNTGGSAYMVSRDGGLSWQALAMSYREFNALCAANLPRNRRADGTLVKVSAEGDGWEQKVSTDKGLTWHITKHPLPEGLERLTGQCRHGNAMTSTGVRLHVMAGRRKDSALSEPFFVRSDDEGRTWQFGSMLDAAPQRIGFNETAVVATADDTIVALARAEPEDHSVRTRQELATSAETAYLYQLVSRDAGRTWSAPVRTPILGFPAHLLRLSDGTILCTYGYREAPMGIRACVSRDHGRTWDVDRTYILRADGQGKGMDLGYPESTELSDGSIFTIYYMNGADNITHVAGTRWTLSY